MWWRFLAPSCTDAKLYLATVYLANKLQLQSSEKHSKQQETQRIQDWSKAKVIRSMGYVLYSNSQKLVTPTSVKQGSSVATIERWLHCHFFFQGLIRQLVSAWSSPSHNVNPIQTCSKQIRNSQKLKGIWDRSVWILMKSRSWIKYVIVCCIGQNLFVGYKYILPPGTSYSNQSLKKYAWPLKELECMTHAMPCKCTEIMNVSGRCVRFIWQTNDIKRFRSIHRIPQSMLTRDPKHPQTVCCKGQGKEKRGKIAQISWVKIAIKILPKILQISIRNDLAGSP